MVLHAQHRGHAPGATIQNAADLRKGAGKKDERTIKAGKVKSAKELRTTYGEQFHSLDGIDNDPLTVPKCVECAHCGWPVTCRDARVATKKTFEKAGIVRDFGAAGAALEAKKAANKTAEAAGEDLNLGEEEKDSDASESDAESDGGLEAKVKDLEEQLQEMMNENESLEHELEEMRIEVESLEEALAAAEEKIELLEESEVRWREKNSVLRVINDELRLYINRLGAHVGDLETDMCDKLTQIENQKLQMAHRERRRGLMLQNMQLKLASFEGEGLLKAVFKLWEERTGRENRRRESQDAEERSRRQTMELSVQLVQERQQRYSAEAHRMRLAGGLKAAGHKMLLKAMSTKMKPWAHGHVLRAWCSVHPFLAAENSEAEARAELAEKTTKLLEEEAITKQLTIDLEQTTTNLRVLTEEHDKLTSIYGIVLAELTAMKGTQDSHAASIMFEAENQAKLAREKLVAEVWALANEKMERMEEAFAAERLALQDEIGSREAELEALKRAVERDKASNDDNARVVPKGQGILCCGCLKQIVNRGVKQLPPVGMPLPAWAKKGEKEAEPKTMKGFFEQELKGQIDGEDILHSEMWKAKQNPMAGLRYADLFVEAESFQTPEKTKSSVDRMSRSLSEFSRSARKSSEDADWSAEQLAVRDFSPPKSPAKRQAEREGRKALTESIEDSGLSPASPSRSRMKLDLKFKPTAGFR